MTPEDSYKFVAALTVQRLLVRELLVRTFGRERDAIKAFDGFAERLTSQLDATTLPQLDPAISDLMAQESADAMRRILEESRAALASRMNRMPPQSMP